MRLAIVLLAGCSLAGCAGWSKPPQTLGDMNAGFRYVAVDPLPVSYNPDFSHCPHGGQHGVLDALHHLAARVSVEQISGEASGKIPVFSIGVSGNTYEVTQDFGAFDLTNLRFEVPSSNEANSTRTLMPGAVKLLGSTEPPAPGKSVVIVPVYVGVGLRLTANVNVLKGNVNLADLGTLSAAAKAERVSGGLVAQTMGLNGAKVKQTLPLPGELNTTTIQAATVAMGSIKALIDDPDTSPWPTVLGIHYPYAKIDPAVVNEIVSQLSSNPVQWTPCATSSFGLKPVRPPSARPSPQ